METGHEALLKPCIKQLHEYTNLLSILLTRESQILKYKIFEYVNSGKNESDTY